MSLFSSFHRMQCFWPKLKPEVVARRRTCASNGYLSVELTLVCKRSSLPPASAAKLPSGSPSLAGVKVAGYLVGHYLGLRSAGSACCPIEGGSSDLEAFDCSGNWGPSLFAGGIPLTNTGALTLASQESMSVSASPRCGWSALQANK